MLSRELRRVRARYDGTGATGLFEGELKEGVGKPETKLRYQREHMVVCISGYMEMYQAGWHRRSNITI